MSHQNDENNLLTSESLGNVQAEHLSFLEEICDDNKINGVPVLKASIYEFIQILNNMYLQHVLQEVEETA